MNAEDTPGFHIAQDVLSGVRSRTGPHRPNGDKEAPHILAAEYTRRLLPWARKLVCHGRERRDSNVRHIKNAPRYG